MANLNEEPKQNQGSGVLAVISFGVAAYLIYLAVSNLM